MKLPKQMCVKVFADGIPQPGMFVRIGIETNFKNNFGFLFGPTDAEGAVVIVREDLLEAARREVAFAIMDFGDPEQDATGLLEVRVVNQEALERAIKACDIYSVSGVVYPPRYAEHIQEARIILAEKQPAKLSVDVQATPSEFRIVKKTVSA